MDKEYVDKKFDEVIEVIRDMAVAMESHLLKTETGLREQIKVTQENIENMRQALRDEIHTSENTLRREIQHGQGKVMEEMREQRDILLRLEHFVLEKVETQGDEIQVINQRVDRIESHVKLPHSLSIAA